MARVHARRLLLLLLPTLAVGTPLVPDHLLHHDQPTIESGPEQPLALALGQSHVGAEDLAKDSALATFAHLFNEGRVPERAADTSGLSGNTRSITGRLSVNRSCRHQVEVVELVKRPFCIPRRKLQCRLVPVPKLLVDRQQPVELCTGEGHGCVVIGERSVVRRVDVMQERCSEHFTLECSNEVVEKRRLQCLDHVEEKEEDRESMENKTDKTEQDSLSPSELARVLDYEKELQQTQMVADKLNNEKKTNNVDTEEERLLNRMPRFVGRLRVF